MNKAIGIGIKSGYVTLSLTVAAATILCLAPRAAVAYAGEGVLDEPVGTATEKAFETPARRHAVRAREADVR